MFLVAKRQLPCDTAGGGSGAENVISVGGGGGGGSYHSTLKGGLNLRGSSSFVNGALRQHLSPISSSSSSSSSPLLQPS